MSVHEHKEKGKKSIRCFVITVSDTRDESTDTSGQTIKKFLADECARERQAIASLKMNPQKSKSCSTKTLGRSDVDAVIVNGGTGIAPRDGTYEVVSRFLEKKLDGFGEIFRYLSYLDIGSAAIMSRAAAGTARGKVLISLPGSQRRCETGHGKAHSAGDPPHGFSAPGKMKVKVKFFAILRERAGAAEVLKEISDGSTVGDLWRAIAERLS